MKKCIFIFFGLALFLSACSQQPPVPDPEVAVLAFPYADGAGKYVAGGRGGLVSHVTTLEDGKNIPGSLRYHLSSPGRKTIVFDVSGIIELKSPLEITNGDLTIAGQSAPGDGICISGCPVIVKTQNVIIRFLRFRMGDKLYSKDDGDAFTCVGCKDVIIDHCSMSWGTDECASAYGNTNFTMQYCIISESLRNSVHTKGSHGYGGIWGGQTVSFHHNLLAHHDSRNPRFCGSRYSNEADKEKVDFRNNVIYNWSMNSGYAGEGGSYNMLNNYYKPGPATYGRKASETRLYRIFQPNSDDGTNNQAQGVWGRFYVAGNVVEGYDDVTADNWTKGIQPNVKDYDGNFNKEQIKAEAEFDFVDYQTSHTAQQAYHVVLEKAGASLKRDVVDTRVVKEVQEGKYTYEGSNGSRYGIIDSQADVGGWPEYSSGELPKDTDLDGIPDEWEDAHGLDKNKHADGKEKTLDKHYTNLEVYLNSLVEHLY